MINRKRVILATLLGILVVCLVYAYLATPRREKAPPRAAGYGVVKNQASKQSPVDKDSQIDFSYLSSNTVEFQGAERNIFAFSTSFTSRRESSASVVEQVVTPVEGVTEIQTESLQPVPIEIIQRSLGQFTFLGFLDKGGEKTVFLSSGGDIFLSKAGERFGTDQEFLVKAIDNNLLKVTHTGGGNQIEIPLIEKEKLRAAVSAPARLPQLPAQPSFNKRMFTSPAARNVQPAAPAENGEPTQDPMEEYQPEEYQPVEIETYNPEGIQEQQPVNRDVKEGEVNGANQ